MAIQAKKRWMIPAALAASQVALLAGGCVKAVPVTTNATALQAAKDLKGSAFKVCPRCGTTLTPQGRHVLAAQTQRVLNRLQDDVRSQKLTAVERHLYQAFVPKASAKLDVTALVHARIPGAHFKLASLKTKADVVAFVRTAARYVACDPPPPPPPPPPVETYDPPPVVDYPPTETYVPPPVVDYPPPAVDPPFYVDPPVYVDPPPPPPPIDPYVEPPSPPDPPPEIIADDPFGGLCCPVDDYI